MSELPTPDALTSLVVDYAQAEAIGKRLHLLSLIEDQVAALHAAAEQGRADSERLEYLIREGWIEASRDEIDRARGVASEVLATGAPSNSED